MIYQNSSINIGLIIITILTMFLLFILYELRKSNNMNKKYSNLIEQLKLGTTIDTDWIKKFNFYLDVLLWFRLKFVFNMEEKVGTKNTLSNEPDISFFDYLLGTSYLTGDNLTSTLSEIIVYINMMISDSFKIQFSRFYSKEYFEIYIQDYILLKINEYSEMLKAIVNNKSNEELLNENLTKLDLCKIEFENIGKEYIIFKTDRNNQ